jgi:transcriptional regulator with XRE-family HTH domain
MAQPALRHRELGDFLRKHRELVAPVETRQFPGQRPRRTPGLRREEIAQIAGISVSWYARLEQGDETAAPSRDALERIATVLQLVPAERNYLFHLAGRIDPNRAADFESRLVVSTVETFVLSLPSPAYLLDKYWTPLLWNTEASSLFSVWLQGSESNLLRHVFLDPAARTFVVGWELRARQLVAQFRTDFANNVEDTKMLELVRELSEGSDVFRSAWTEQRVSFRDGDAKSYTHPQFGLLKFFQTTFLVAAEPSLKLVVATPRN